MSAFDIYERGSLSLERLEDECRDMERRIRALEEMLEAKGYVPHDPGPAHHLCGRCSRPVYDSHPLAQCERCNAANAERDE